MNEIVKVVLSLSASAGLITGLLLLARPLIRRWLHKSWQYYIWLVVVARLLLPFAPEANLVDGIVRRASAQPSSGQMQADAQMPAGDGEEEPHAVDFRSADPAPAAARDATPLSDLKQSLWLVWAAPALVLLVRKITSYHSFVRFIRAGSREAEDPQMLDTYFTACEDQGISHPVSLYINELAVSPMLVGILRPCIVLPAAEFDEDELYLVFRHELVHYRRRDILYKWLVQITLCVHWFNPLVYLMSREVDKACELSCDEMVLRGMDAQNRHRYGDALLSAVKGGGRYGDTVASVTLSEDGKLLKERLEAILRHGSKSRAVAAGSAALGVLLLCTAAYAGAYSGSRTGVHAPQQAAEREFEQSQAVAVQTAQKDEKTTTWLLPGSFQQNYYYRDGYLFCVQWRSNDTTRYSPVFELEYASRTYRIAFAEKVREYGEDDRMVEAVRTAILSRLENGDTMRWEANPFVVVEAHGRFDETPEQLVTRYYEEQNFTLFSVLLEHVDPQTLVDLIHRAYEDHRDNYLMLLCSHLPDTVKLDDLAERAAAEGRSAALLWFSDHVGDNEEDELTDRAMGLNTTWFATEPWTDWDALEDLDSLDDLDDLAEQAYNSGNLPGLSSLVNSGRVSDNMVARLAERAYTDSSLAMYSVLTGRLSNSAKAELAIRAYEDQKLTFFSTVAEGLSQVQAADLAERAYESGRIPYFSILIDFLPADTLSSLAKRAFAEQKYSFQAMLMDFL